MQLILSYNEVAVLRYTYCSILGFMASVREDLVLGFLVALNLVLGGFLGAVSEKPGDLFVALEPRGTSPLIVSNSAAGRQFPIGGELLVPLLRGVSREYVPISCSKKCLFMSSPLNIVSPLFRREL